MAASEATRPFQRELDEVTAERDELREAALAYSLRAVALRGALEEIALRTVQRDLSTLARNALRKDDTASDEVDALNRLLAAAGLED
jgi:hypothetical protein